MFISINNIFYQERTENITF